MVMCGHLSKEMVGFRLDRYEYIYLSPFSKFLVDDPDQALPRLISDRYRLALCSER